MDMREKVEEFHVAFNHPVDKDINYYSADEVWFRHKLINEEFKELSLALTNADQYIVFRKDIPVEIKENIYKELADLLYVVHGFAVTFGVPIDEVFRRVHKSNMSKLGADGKPIFREDGKVLKGPNYKEPDLKDLLK